jgi:hypothetical protein
MGTAIECCGSSVSIAAMLRARLPVFDSGQGLGLFLFATASRPAMRPTQPHIQWVLGFLSLWVKRPWNEADHSLRSSVEDKNQWSYTSTFPVRHMTWCWIKQWIRLHGVVLWHLYPTAMERDFRIAPDNSGEEGVDRQMTQLNLGWEPGTEVSHVNVVWVLVIVFWCCHSKWSNRNKNMDMREGRKESWENVDEGKT